MTVRRARLGEGRALGAVGFAAWAGCELAVNDAGWVDRVALLADFEKLGDEPPADLRFGGFARLSRRGAGAALLAALEAEIAAAGWAEAELETLASNSKAVGFCKRHGFIVTWRGWKFSTSLGYAIDKVRMNKNLGK